MVNETLRLTAHEKFIIDGIKRQAGTVEKAVLELVMNAIEAQLSSRGKPKVWINFTVEDDKAMLVVRDNGRGFKSRLEVEEWFAKFGTPHDECPKCKATMKLSDGSFACECGYETEGRTWAEFRMGRGQAFSYGRNIWRTGQFRMEYDLETLPEERSYAKGDGSDHILDFSLTSGLENHKGCEVTVHFYENPIGGYYASFENLKAAIKRHVEFMEGEILFNDEQINTPASELKWDIETDDALFMFGKGAGFSLYNLGAFVHNYPAEDAGVTGVAVSKGKLVVNFARNDVQQSCPVFKRIWKVIRANKIKKARNKSRRLEKHEKSSILCDIRDGLIHPESMRAIGLVELSNGNVTTLDTVRKIRSVWTFAPIGDVKADHLEQAGEAVCFSLDMLESLNYSGDERDFFTWLLQESMNADLREYGYLKGRKNWEKMKSFYRPFTGLSSTLNSTSRIIPTSKLNAAERRFLRVMESYGCWDGRTLCIGVSQVYNAWTDGRRYIAFNRKYLQRYRPTGHYGAAAMVTLAMHEVSHNGEDLGSHVHSFEFYQAYHEKTRGGALWMIGDLPGKMSKAKWEDEGEKVKEKERKANKARDNKLGLIPKKKVADAITHQPVKKTVSKPKPKRRIKRF